MARTHVSPEAPTSDWMATGALFGVVAGIVMALFEMVAAAAMGMSALAPIRMIAGIALGAEVAMGEGSLATAVIVGLLVHLVLSAIYGAVLGAIVAAVPSLRASKAGIALAATVFGLLLWLVNFYVFAPAFFPWFTNADAGVQFVAHTFFFGSVLGLLVDSRLRLPAGRDVPIR